VTKPEIILCPGGAGLARIAAERFVAHAAEAESRAGRFAVALSGGSTPAALYRLLAAPPFRARVDWPRVHFFWGDERCVPPDHEESNFRMAKEALLSPIEAPERNIHRMRGEQEPALAAAAYADELRLFFGSGLPRFDLVFLGLGEDGHTASLFPGSPALAERRRLVAAVHVEKLRSHRLTLTLPVLNAAAHAMFLVDGASKKEIVGEIFRASDAPERYPAARIRPADGDLAWLIGADAAGALPAELLGQREE
jgi:6-phosphogluconolactonase